MDKEELKSKYQRFKQWQEQPYEYKLVSDKVNHCNNCGNDYIGNFCPICSQKNGVGRIGWQSVRQGIMDIWGLGTRSLLYSIWQLLWRPGHLIGDYIDGKRQVSFPPVKMLFIVAVVYSMIYYWFLPDVLGLNIFNGMPEEQIEAAGNYIKGFQSYYSWVGLLMAILAVLPTWVMFRFSPRHTTHTLPEGFFIQIFLAVVMIVLSLLFSPLSIMNLWLYDAVVLFIFGIYYLIVYKYLFGYGFWGTLWRCGFILITIVFIVLAFTVIVLLYYKNPDIKEALNTPDQIRQVTMAYVSSLLLALMTFFVGWVINLIATRKYRRELKEAAMR